MCGITGFVDFNKNSDRIILEKMNRIMAHRGPDGEGYKFFEKEKSVVGLGHRRLSIIDLSIGGNQPRQFENLHITFNGEVYNYEEIKKELEALGHTFESNSDTEVVLHSYKEWGEGALQKFIGMFAFAIFDEYTNKIFACRDRAGVKPFFYYYEDGLFLFASELKAFMEHPTFKKEININSVAAFMQFGYVPTPHCIFNNAYKLKPGHFLEFDVNNNKITTTQYWNVYDAYNKPKITINFEDAKAETEKLLKSACDYRMIADVPVGVFLSGGYDSTTVAALLQKDRTDKIKTFTIGVPDAGLNEAPYAKDIAKYLGTDHTEFYCTEKEALEMIPDLPFNFDEPFADSSAIPTTLVSKIARKEVTVALSADAGDEVFAGYNRYDFLSKYGKKLNATPAILRKAIGGIMDVIPADKIPILKNKYNFHDRYEKVKNLLIDPSPHKLMLNLSQHYNEEQVQKLFLDKITHLPTAFESKELKREFYDDLSFMLAIDYQNYLLDDILQKVDRATMAVSLEGREPFLDHRVIEWAAQLPNQYKYNNGNKKYILKEINKKYIPESLMDRPKMGFGIPIAKWLAEDLKDMVQDFCGKQKIENQKIFNPAEIEKLLKDFYGGKKELANKVWYLLMFQMWMDKWAN